jgi:hypothetical protein
MTTKRRIGALAARNIDQAGTHSAVGYTPRRFGMASLLLQRSHSQDSI